TPLRNDQLRKLCRDVHVRLFERAARKRATAAGRRLSNIGLPRSKASQEIVRTIANQPLFVGKRRKRDLAERGSLSVAEGPLNRAVRLDDVAQQAATREPVLVRA